MSGSADGAVKKVTFLLTCVDVDSCSVVFEPLGMEYILTSGDIFRVVMTGPASGDFEITYSPGAISVTDWPGADTKVWNKAGETLLDLDPP